MLHRKDLNLRLLDFHYYFDTKALSHRVCLQILDSASWRENFVLLPNCLQLISQRRGGAKFFTQSLSFRAKGEIFVARSTKIELSLRSYLRRFLLMSKGHKMRITLTTFLLKSLRILATQNLKTLIKNPHNTLESKVISTHFSKYPLPDFYRLKQILQNSYL